MILVVWGHSNIPYGLNKLLLSLHMPLFFFISGYLFNPDKNKDLSSFFKKKTRSLLVPYFSFSALSYLFWVIVERRVQGLDIHILKPLAGIFLSVNEDFYMIFNGVLWFITCLFVVEVLFFIIQKQIKKRKMLIAVLLLFSCLGYLSTFLPIRLVWNVDVALTAVTFYGMGFLSKGIVGKAQEYSNGNKVLLITSGLSINFIFTQMNDVVYMYLNEYGNFLYFYVAAVAGIASFLLLAMMMEKVRILSFIGANTFVYLAAHGKVLMGLSFGTRLVLKLPDEVFLGSLLWGTIFTLITIILLIPVVYVINTYFPFLLGKRVPKRINSIRQETAGS